jgi:hypothetical protein
VLKVAFGQVNVLMKPLPRDLGTLDAGRLITVCNGNKRSLLQHDSVSQGSEARRLLKNYEGGKKCLSGVANKACIHSCLDCSLSLIVGGTSGESLSM